MHEICTHLLWKVPFSESSIESVMRGLGESEELDTGDHAAVTVCLHWELSSHPCFGCPVGLSSSTALECGMAM